MCDINEVIAHSVNERKRKRVYEDALPSKTSKMDNSRYKFILDTLSSEASNVSTNYREEGIPIKSKKRFCIIVTFCTESESQNDDNDLYQRYLSRQRYVKDTLEEDVEVLGELGSVIVVTNKRSRESPHFKDYFPENWDTKLSLIVYDDHHCETAGVMRLRCFWIAYEIAERFELFIIRDDRRKLYPCSSSTSTRFIGKDEDRAFETRHRLVQLLDGGSPFPSSKAKYADSYKAIACDEIMTVPSQMANSLANPNEVNCRNASGVWKHANQCLIMRADLVVYLRRKKISYPIGPILEDMLFAKICAEILDLKLRQTAGMVLRTVECNSIARPGDTGNMRLDLENLWGGEAEKVRLAILMANLMQPSTKVCKNGIISIYFKMGGSVKMYDMKPRKAGGGQTHAIAAYLAWQQNKENTPISEEYIPAGKEHSIFAGNSIPDHFIKRHSVLDRARSDVTYNEVREGLYRF